MCESSQLKQRWKWTKRLTIGAARLSRRGRLHTDVTAAAAASDAAPRWKLMTPARRFDVAARRRCN